MPHILFLMSDTGGGHRAAAGAIEAALQQQHPGEFTTQLVDVWKDYYPFPFNTLPRNYSRWVNSSPGSYSAQYWIMDRVLRPTPAGEIYRRMALPRMKRLFQDYPADIIVCVHSVFARPGAYAVHELGISAPFITVITDYAWPPIAWYDSLATCTLVPTQPAYERGLALGLDAQRMRLTGAPVHPKFTNLSLTQAEARAELGWEAQRPSILLVGGGDGMGPLLATAHAIDAKHLDCELVIVAGRNEVLKSALDEIAWQGPTRVYGFVDNMQVLMKAADAMISKAGPASITEAAILGVPLVLSGAIKYQESPNVDYVVAHGAGVYAPGPQRVADSLAGILADGGKQLEQLKAGVKKLAQPDAIWKIAREIWSYV
jgi:1,2-diacylglycerol 3-beta-galactosyltransferase